MMARHETFPARDCVHGHIMPHRDRRQVPSELPKLKQGSSLTRHPDPSPGYPKAPNSTLRPFIPSSVRLFNPSYSTGAPKGTVFVSSCLPRYSSILCLSWCFFLWGGGSVSTFSHQSAPGQNAEQTRTDQKATPTQTRPDAIHPLDTSHTWGVVGWCCSRLFCYAVLPSTHVRPLSLMI